MARICLEELGFDYKINYLNNNLNGQYRKDVSSEKMMSLLPDFEFTPFNKGIKHVYNLINE